MFWNSLQQSRSGTCVWSLLCAPRLLAPCLSKLVVIWLKLCHSVIAHLNLVLDCINSCLDRLALAGVEAGYLAVRNDDSGTTLLQYFDF